MTDSILLLVREKMIQPPSDSVPLTGYRSALAAPSRGAEYHLVIFSSWREELGVTWRGKLFSSLTSPGHLETKALKSFQTKNIITCYNIFIFFSWTPLMGLSLEHDLVTIHSTPLQFITVQSSGLHYIPIHSNPFKSISVNFFQFQFIL